MLTVVVDTNILFSALYDLRSNAGRLLFLALKGRVELKSPVYAREELERNLREKLGYTDGELRETLKAMPVTWVEETHYSKEMERASRAIEHERDVPVLALAIALKCGVVSGDRHFKGVDMEGFSLWELKALVEHLESCR